MRQATSFLLLTALTFGLLAAATLRAQVVMTVESPNGGENWARGTSHWVRWNCDTSGTASLQLYRHAGEQNDFVLSIAGGQSCTGHYLWTVPNNLAVGANYRVKIYHEGVTSIYDWSDENFAVSVAPAITLLAPNGGENWLLGSTHSITWTDNLAGAMRLDLWRADSLAITVASEAPNSGSFTWHIPADLTEGSNYRVRLRSVLDSTAEDWSDSTFTLTAPPSLRVLSPNGGERWFVGDTVAIRWSSVHLAGEAVRIDLKRNYPASSWVTLAASAENTGQFAWRVNGPSTTTARIRIVPTIHPSVADTSDAGFSITDALQAPVLTIGTDSLHTELRWRAVAGARLYHVWSSPNCDGSYGLLTTTADTMVTVDTMPVRQFYRVVAFR